jgi:hypothetical protein
MGRKRVHFDFYDKLFLVVLHGAADIKHRLTLVKPETLLAWQRTLLKRFWTFEHRPARSTSFSRTASDHIRESSNRSRSLMSERRSAARFAGVVCWVDCITIITGGRLDRWKKSPSRGIT